MRTPQRCWLNRAMLLVLALSLMSGCASAQLSAPIGVTLVASTATSRTIASPTRALPPTTKPPTATLILALTPTPTLAIVAEPSQPCQRPPDDYTRVEINGETINARTWWMLKLAQALYTGRGDPLRVVQGSYVNDLAESFGTHAGGGAVDISVRVKADLSKVMTDEEAAEMVQALRQAGFAAWVRLPGDLDPSTAIHIHAIAVGDRELSDAARRQLDGPEGYFRGLNGVPPDHGGVKADRHGGPIVCAWVADYGYADLR